MLWAKPDIGGHKTSINIIMILPCLKDISEEVLYSVNQ